MKNFAAVASFSLLSGCVIYADGGPDGNGAPSFSYADAGCYWDDYYNDFVWYFDADVQDPDGSGDVDLVYVDVYDGVTGRFVDTFDLAPEAGANWFSAWVASSTYMDPAYGQYYVEFTAVDYKGVVGYADVNPAPCM